jgi:hypothetical protein
VPEDNPTKTKLMTDARAVPVFIGIFASGYCG